MFEFRGMLSVLVLLGFLSAPGCRNNGEHLANLPDVKVGEEIVQRIDAFKQKNGRLPSSLAEAGVRSDLQSKYFYQASAGNDYQVWFGEDLGESITYDSKLRSWNRHN